MLALDESLLYLVGTEEDPAALWKKLEGQFQQKSFVSRRMVKKKLEARRC